MNFQYYRQEYQKKAKFQTMQLDIRGNTKLHFRLYKYKATRQNMTKQR